MPTIPKILRPFTGNTLILLFGLVQYKILWKVERYFHFLDSESFKAITDLISEG